MSKDLRSILKAPRMMLALSLGIGAALVLLGTAVARLVFRNSPVSDDELNVVVAVVQLAIAACLVWMLWARRPQRHTVVWVGLVAAGALLQGIGSLPRLPDQLDPALLLFGSALMVSGLLAGVRLERRAGGPPAHKT